METMYSMSLQLHFGFVLVWLGIIVFNAAMLQFAVQAPDYVRRARIVMPFSVMAIAAMAFTGVVMMAAKHLSFSLENIAMIMITVVLIVLEARRYKTVRRLRTKLPEALLLYRPFALKLLGAEFVLTMLMTLWMSLL
ncbi:hypothetical protein LOH54_11790 [Sulfurimonas sp. HSL-3221]|uniref:hypothetical protein n=1 Tax=Sulfurimonadaceae TaxID=2771471 RepID=UPI001E30BAA8|nr:hypothetical protein [Sulfurimonas sp. HSL-3221]UFS62320.1 hypothetical protein LOH54_11790 [Sulfurimonas sp. HSL-3221]